MEGDILEVIGNMEEAERKEANRVLHEFELEVCPWSPWHGVAIFASLRMHMLCLTVSRETSLPLTQLHNIALRIVYFREVSEMHP